jgi:histone acetyltransferase HTATIP
MASEESIAREESIEAVSLISDGLAAVMEGCRLPVKMTNSTTGTEEWPKAEVIAIKASETAPSMYYVHYVDYNKRLDEWVTEDRLAEINWQLI